MGLDYKAYRGYLDEAEAQLLTIGATKCNRLLDLTQLSAAVFLLIRAISLFRSALSHLESGPLDAYDAVRRAYLETWLLAYEFRLEQSGPKAARWHLGYPMSWSPDIKRIEAYSKSQGIKVPMLGSDYGGLSQLAHPTKAAAENSVAVATAPHGNSVASRSLSEAKASFERKDVPEMMYRLLWLIIEERKSLIRIEVDLTAMPAALKYANEYSP
jgi:hypothetical protein